MTDTADTKVERNRRRTVQGRVASAKMEKTIVVKVERLTKHPLYGKYVRQFTSYYAHDAEGQAKEGDTVELVSTRPMSKLKRWRLIRIVHAAPDLGGVDS